MKAMVLKKYNDALVLEERIVPDINEGEALVRVKACGICATDVKISEGKGPKSKLPLVLGHEGAGIVANVRKDSNFKVGDSVVIHPHIYCGKCTNCLSGNENICLNVKGSLGMTLDGCLEEYIKIKEDNLVKFDKKISYEEAALAGGTVAVPLSAIRRLGNILGNKILVFGLGALGMNAIQILKSAGAEVIALGRNSVKLAIATKLGADKVFSSEEDDWESRLNEEGVDVAIDFAGSAEQIPRLLKALRRGGRLVTVGYSDQDLHISYQKLALDAMQIIGSRSYTRTDLRLAVNMVELGKVTPLIDSTFALKDANQALALTKKAGLKGRVVIGI
jgi:propanol-preferring alcohol dehydrogenase